MWRGCMCPIEALADTAAVPAATTHTAFAISAFHANRAEGVHDSTVDFFKSSVLSGRI